MFWEGYNMFFDDDDEYYYRDDGTQTFVLAIMIATLAAWGATIFYLFKVFEKWFVKHIKPHLDKFWIEKVKPIIIRFFENVLKPAYCRFVPKPIKFVFKKLNDWLHPF